MEHCTIFVRLTEKITIGSLESYENQHVQSAKPRIAFYTFLRLKMPNLILFFDFLCNAWHQDQTEASVKIRRFADA